MCVDASILSRKLSSVKNAVMNFTAVVRRIDESCHEKATGGK